MSQQEKQYPTEPGSDAAAEQQKPAQQQQQQPQPEGYGGQGSDSAMQRLRVWEQQRAALGGRKHRPGSK